MSDPGPIRRAYDATWGRMFAALYDRGLARAEDGELGRRRAEIVGAARGRTLEIGAGTGLNLHHYPPAVTELVLTEPFEPMARRLRERVAAERPGTEIVETGAERLPFADSSFDTVVATLVLCTVADQAAALSEIARVLQPGGRLLFLEHVRAPSPGLARTQDIVHGPWYFVGHGCHCNRDTVAAIRAAGLDIDELTEDEMRGVPPVVRPSARGSAVRPL